jgi:hypothetical protein
MSRLPINGGISRAVPGVDAFVHACESPALRHLGVRFVVSVSSIVTASLFWEIIAEWRVSLNTPPDNEGKSKSSWHR